MTWRTTRKEGRNAGTRIRGKEQRLNDEVRKRKKDVKEEYGDRSGMKKQKYVRLKSKERR